MDTRREREMREALTAQLEESDEYFRQLVGAQRRVENLTCVLKYRHDLATESLSEAFRAVEAQIAALTAEVKTSIENSFQEKLALLDHERKDLLKTISGLESMRVEAEELIYQGLDSSLATAGTHLQQRLAVATQRRYTPLSYNVCVLDFLPVQGLTVGAEELLGRVQTKESEDDVAAEASQQQPDSESMDVKGQRKICRNVLRELQDHIRSNISSTLCSEVTDPAGEAGAEAALIGDSEGEEVEEESEFGAVLRGTAIGLAGRCATPPPPGLCLSWPPGLGAKGQLDVGMPRPTTFITPQSAPIATEGAVGSMVTKAPTVAMPKKVQERCHAPVLTSPWPQLGKIPDFTALGETSTAGSSKPAAEDIYHWIESRMLAAKSLKLTKSEPGPVEARSMSGPVEAWPKSGPVEAKPNSGPDEAIPASDRVEAWLNNETFKGGPKSEPVMPIGGPVEAKPRSGPVKAQALTSPVEAKPIRSPVEAKPKGGPVEAKAITSPVEAKPIRSPDEAKPIGGPVEAKALTSPVEAKPKGGPVEAKAIISPVEVKPKGGPVKAKAIASPVEAKPKGDIAQTKPKGDTAQAKQKCDTAQAKRKGDTAQSKPKGDTAASKLKDDAVQAKPKGDTSQTKPKDDTSQTKPKGGAAQAKPKGGSGDKKCNSDSKWVRSVASKTGGSRPASDANNNVNILNTVVSGTLVGTFGAGQLTYPIGVTVNENTGDVIACSPSTNEVKLFGWQQGDCACVIKGKTAMEYPSAVLALPDNRLVVKDNRSVRVFSPEGAELCCMGAGKLKRPYGLAVDSSGLLLTLDVDGSRAATVTWFDARCKPQDACVKTHDFPPISGGKRGSKLRFLALHGNTLAVSDLGLDQLYITDLPSGTYSTVGGSGRAPGLFNQTAGVTTDAGGNLLVADSKNHRVQLFTLGGEFVTQLQLDSIPRRPSDIYLTAGGQLLVSCMWEHLVKAYQLH